VPWAPFLSISAEAVSAASSAVEKLMHRGAELLYQHYLLVKSQPYAVTTSLAQLLNLLEVAYFRRDWGEPGDWGEDEEPEPAVIDSWARSQVTVKRKVMIQSPQPPSVPNDAKSVRSGQSSTSRISRVATHRRNRTAEQPIKEYVAIPIDIVETEEPEFNLMNRPRIEQQLQAKRRQQERIAKEIKEALEIARKKEREQADLAKKPLTYDYEGKVIFTKPLVTKNTLYQPKFSLKTSEVLQKSKRTASAEVGALKEKKTPLRELEFIKSLKTQNTMWDVINSKLGVVIKEGSKAKGGPPATAGRVSRKEYMRKVRTASSNVSKGSLPASDHKSQASKPPTLGEVPDYETEPQGALSFQVLGQPRIVQYHSKEDSFVEEPSEIDKFNSSILDSADWGVNPPIHGARLPTRMPRRPDAKTQQRTHGYKTKLPRERPLNEHVGKRVNLSGTTDSTRALET
jgi:hypothetical protein